MLGGEQVVLHLGVVLVGQHRTVVDVEHGDNDDHDEGQDAVIVVGDLAQEHGDTGAGEAFGHVGRNGGGPGGHGSQHTHGGGSGVDDVRQLGPGDLVGLGDGTHNSAHGQAVEIVVDEDQHAQQHGQQLRAHAGLHGLLGPAAEGGRAAGLVHQVHHDAQDHQEDQDGDVDGVDHTNTLAGTDKVHYRLPGSEVSQQQRRDQAAQEQRGIHFLADQGQGDGDHGGEQSPAGGHKAGTVVGDLGDDQRHDDDRQGYAIRDLCTFLFHVCDLPPHKLVVNTISRRNSVSAPPTSCIIPSRQDIVKFLTSYSIILTNCELRFRRFYKRNRAANTASCAFYGRRHKSFRVRGRKKRRRCGGTGVPSVK